MKRLILLLTFILASAFVAQAQISSQRVINRTADPVICSPGFLYHNTVTGALFRGSAGSACVADSAGSGDVTGPASSTDNTIPRFHLTTGKVIQPSLVTIDDNGSVNIPTGQAYKINNVALAKGDVGLGNVDNTSDATKDAAVATLTNKTLTSPVINTPTGIVKGDVGLGSVDNTSDAAKPVSTAQQTALDLKANLASPVFTTLITTPAIDGGSAANDDITIQGTSNATRTTSYVNLQPSGGNVGIATDSPTRSLDVNGFIQTRTAYLFSTNDDVLLARGGAGRLYLGALGTGATALDWQYSGTIYGRVAIDSVGSLALSTTGGANNHVVLSPDGNVGVKTTTPSSTLSINGGLHVGGDSDAGDNNLLVDGNAQAASYSTVTNCADSAGAAACGSAAAGSVVIDAAATDVVVSTTAVSADSQIFIQEDSSLNTRLGITCNTTIARTYVVTARTAGTSFTITASAAPVSTPACLSYKVVN